MESSEHTHPTVADPRSFGVRFWIYLGERFPLAHHSVLILALATSAVCYSALVRSPTAIPSVQSGAVAALVLLIVFFQLRVADEHKDAQTDARYRPERAVPRGLVSLGELRRVALVGGVVQLALAAALHPGLVVLLLVVWAWAGLMTAEFFAPRWLMARPVLYLASHMAIMPLIDLFATACDWLVAGEASFGKIAVPLGAYLALSLGCGATLEIARKSWAPMSEREGVDTYSKLWGPRRAGLVLAGVIAVSYAMCVGVNVLSPASMVWLIASGTPALAAIVAAVVYARRPCAKTAGRLELTAGVFVLMAYLASGPGSMGVRLWTG